MKKLFFLILILFPAVSCQTGEEPLFSFQSFVTADNGILYGDVGESFEPSVKPEMDLSSGRYFIQAFATQDLGNNRYRIIIDNITTVSLEEPLINSKIKDQELIGHDAIQPILGYAAGKYLNLRSQFAYEKDTKGHTFNLVFDDKKSNEDTIYFDLRHQANKDTLRIGGNIKGAQFFSSYEIRHLAPEKKNKVVIALRNKWYKTDFSGYLPELEDQINFLNYNY